MASVSSVVPEDSPANGRQTVQSGSIRAIGQGTVHRICSGQVVLNLATAVKELVENSLDAGATSIDVRLKDHGSSLVEVSDNGNGVQEINFQGLTLKHHTSKIREFSDLTSVETFGFRGEALSSLAALSDLSVVTRHEDAQVGTKLVYDHNGKIVSRTPSPRQTGTTIALQRLFYTLPVRHKEFLRNNKKEFSKMVHVLNAYCLISTGVRITCTNQVEKGNKVTIVSTGGLASIRENVSCIFGSKQVQSLMEFKQVQPKQNVCEDLNVTHPEGEISLFRIRGFVSECDHGRGRSTADRQFIFINKRPCDSSKVSKAVNEVYHAYNRHQYPFFVLDIALNKDSVDVNVTPDKRQIFIEKEKLLLATIKSSLLEMFEPRSSVFVVNRVVPERSTVCSPERPTVRSCPSDFNFSQSEVTTSSSLSAMKRSFTSAFSEAVSTVPAEPTQKQQRLDTFLRHFESPTQAGRRRTSPEKSPYEDRRNHTSLTTAKVSPQDVEPSVRESATFIERTQERETCLDDSPPNNETKDTRDCYKKSTESNKLEYISNVSEYRNSIGDENRMESTPLLQEGGSPSRASQPTSSLPAMEDEVAWESVVEDDSSLTPHDRDSEPDDASARLLCSPAHCLDASYCEGIGRKERVVEFSLNKLMESIRTRRSDPGRSHSSDPTRLFRSKITPADNKKAVDELDRVISKDSFKEMEILGQFNLGFIVARLGTDLFIIDQHASDEKYNFEMLQKHTVIKNQTLIQPKVLELTAVNESILIDNRHIFEKNGFRFTIDEHAPVTQRIHLTSMPVSKNWEFGKEDVEELVFMLTDAPGIVCRPSRILRMFASRACRKSTMIGTALNRIQMKKLVRHMGEIDQPWNCPHGRPTMRHLINLNMVRNDGAS